MKKSKAQKDLADWTAGKRPGLSRKTKQKPLDKLTLGDIEKLSVKLLQENPLNPYPSLTREQIHELVADIKDKGVLVPLIARPDGVLLCGHNRLKAAILAGLKTVPVQTVLHPKKLSKSLQLEIMHSENDKRRGGNWTKTEKVAWIKKNFAAEIPKDKRGGKSKSKSEALDKQIEQTSKGRITAGTAKRLLAEIRKETKTKSKTRSQLQRVADNLAAEIQALKAQLRDKERKLAEIKAELAKKR